MQILVLLCLASFTSAEQRVSVEVRPRGTQTMRSERQIHRHEGQSLAQIDPDNLDDLKQTIENDVLKSMMKNGLAASRRQGSAAQDNCFTCPRGCIVYGRCFYKDPETGEAGDGVCKKRGGTLCPKESDMPPNSGLISQQQTSESANRNSGTLNDEAMDRAFEQAVEQREAGRVKADAAEAKTIEARVMNKLEKNLQENMLHMWNEELEVIKTDMGKLTDGIRQTVTDAINDANRNVDRDPIKNGVHVARTVIEDDMPTYSTSTPEPLVPEAQDLGTYAKSDDDAASALQQESAERMSPAKMGARHQREAPSRMQTHGRKGVSLFEGGGSLPDQEAAQSDEATGKDFKPTTGWDLTPPQQDLKAPTQKKESDDDDDEDDDGGKPAPPTSVLDSHHVVSKEPDFDPDWASKNPEKHKRPQPPQDSAPKPPKSADDDSDKENVEPGSEQSFDPDWANGGSKSGHLIQTDSSGDRPAGSSDDDHEQDRRKPNVKGSDDLDDMDNWGKPGDNEDDDGGAKSKRTSARDMPPDDDLMARERSRAKSRQALLKELIPGTREAPSSDFSMKIKHNKHSPEHSLESDADVTTMSDAEAEALGEPVKKGVKKQVDADADDDDIHNNDPLNPDNMAENKGPGQDLPELQDFHRRQKKMAEEEKRKKKTDVDEDDSSRPKDNLAEKEEMSETRRHQAREQLVKRERSEQEGTQLSDADRFLTQEEAQEDVGAKNRPHINTANLPGADAREQEKKEEDDEASNEKKELQFALKAEKDAETKEEKQEAESASLLESDADKHDADRLMAEGRRKEVMRRHYAMLESLASDLSPSSGAGSLLQKDDIPEKLAPSEREVYASLRRQKKAEEEANELWEEKRHEAEKQLLMQDPNRDQPLIPTGERQIRAQRPDNSATLAQLQTKNTESSETKMGAGERAELMEEMSANAQVERRLQAVHADEFLSDDPKDQPHIAALAAQRRQEMRAERLGLTGNDLKVSLLAGDLDDSHPVDTRTPDEKNDPLEMEADQRVLAANANVGAPLKPLGKAEIGMDPRVADFEKLADQRQNLVIASLAALGQDPSKATAVQMQTLKEEEQEDADDGEVENTRSDKQQKPEDDEADAEARLKEKEKERLQRRSFDDESKDPSDPLSKSDADMKDPDAEAFGDSDGKNVQLNKIPPHTHLEPMDDNSDSGGSSDPDEPPPPPSATAKVSASQDATAIQSPRHGEVRFSAPQARKAASARKEQEEVKQARKPAQRHKSSSTDEEDKIDGLDGVAADSPKTSHTEKTKKNPKVSETGDPEDDDAGQLGETKKSKDPFGRGDAGEASERDARVGKAAESQPKTSSSSESSKKKDQGDDTAKASPPKEKKHAKSSKKKDDGSGSSSKSSKKKDDGSVDKKNPDGEAKPKTVTSDLDSVIDALNKMTTSKSTANKDMADLAIADEAAKAAVKGAGIGTQNSLTTSDDTGFDALDGKISPNEGGSLSGSLTDTPTYKDLENELKADSISDPKYDIPDTSSSDPVSAQMADLSHLSDPISDKTQTQLAVDEMEKLNKELKSSQGVDASLDQSLDTSDSSSSKDTLALAGADAALKGADLASFDSKNDPVGNQADDPFKKLQDIASPSSAFGGDDMSLSQ